MQQLPSGENHPMFGRILSEEIFHSPPYPPLGGPKAGKS